MQDRAPLGRDTPFDMEEAVTEVLALLSTDRQRDIVSRRLGLFGEKEQLKDLSRRFRTVASNVHKIVAGAQTQLQSAVAQSGVGAAGTDAILRPLRGALSNAGGALRLADFALQLGLARSDLHERQLAFLANACPDLYVIETDDRQFATTVQSSAYSRPPP